MTTNGISESLRAAILAAIEAYEQDEMPIRNLASSSTDAWRVRGRRMIMNMRYATGRTLPALPSRRRGASQISGRTS
ncbi:MAG: hypothetical protein OXC55_02100 [Chloroflexi bacterium]|nr:hypothetical protein [Chloroflexota bacterium]